MPALRDLAGRYGNGIHIVYAVHPNPNVSQPIHRLLDVAGITLASPLDYLSLVHLVKRCFLVLTDSGGLQKEAPRLGKPTLALRNIAEQPEAVEAGAVEVVGTDRERIVAEAEPSWTTRPRTGAWPGP